MFNMCKHGKGSVHFHLTMLSSGSVQSLNFLILSVRSTGNISIYKYVEHDFPKPTIYRNLFENPGP